MTKEGYVPMSEVFSPSVRTSLVLPFGLSEQVGINLKKVEKLAQIGGLRTLHIKNDPSGETTKIERTIVGMNKDGSAMAGGSKVQYAPTSGLEMKQDQYKTHAARWADVTITINTQELQERLLHGGKTVTKPSTWAPDINKAVTKELRKAGNKQLLEIKQFDYFSTFLIHGWNTFAAAVDAMDGNSAAVFAGSFIAKYFSSGLIWITLNPILYGNEKQGEGSRYTFGIGPEIDRALIFNLMLLGKPLITDLNDLKNKER